MSYRSWVFIPICVIVVFSAFFLGALTDRPFAGDNAFYASELICGDKLASPQCTGEPSKEIALFRGNVGEDTSQQFKNVRYQSASFAKFVRFFFHDDDSYRTIIIKIFVVKSLLIALALVFVVLFVAKYAYLYQTARRMFVAMFSVPFVFETAGGFYPAGLSLFGLLACLLILEVIQREPKNTARGTIPLLGVFSAFAAIVVSTRFETTAFLTLACCMTAVRCLHRFRNRRTRKSPILMPLLIVVALAGGAAATNSASARVYREAATRELFIVPPNTPSRSVDIVKDVGLPGDFAFSFMAPLTMIDNSTRYFINRTYRALFESDRSNNQIGIPLLILYAIVSFLVWFPLFLLFGEKLFRLLVRISFAARRRVPFELPDMMTLVPIMLYLVIPTYTRGVWSWWYLIPLLMILVSTFSEQRLTRIDRIAYRLTWFNSITSLAIVNLGLGDLHLGGTIIQVELLTALMIASTSLVFLGFTRRGFAILTRTVSRSAFD